MYDVQTGYYPPVQVLKIRKRGAHWSNQTGDYKADTYDGRTPFLIELKDDKVVS